MKTVYHLNLTDELIQGAQFAFLPGDPFRVEAIARAFDPESRELAYKREYRTFIGRIKGIPVLVTSTGIGGPSAGIAIDELAQLGVRNFLRIGTTGAIHEDINVGDVIITTASVRLDGTSAHYAPIEYPAVSAYEMVHALVQAGISTGIKTHTGITASCDTFYPGQERYDSYSGYVPRRFQGITEEWRKLHVLNYEMESSTVLTLCSALGLKGGCVTGVVVNRSLSEEVTPEGLKTGEENAIKVGIRAMEMLVRNKSGH